MTELDSAPGTDISEAGKVAFPDNFWVRLGLMGGMAVEACEGCVELDL
jgi:hypothetical protein